MKFLILFLLCLSAAAAPMDMRNPEWWPSIATVATTSPASPSSLITNLVACWRMDEASGTRVDSVGSYNLTDINSTPSIVGLITNAATNAASCQLYNSNAWQTWSNTDVTINVWACPNGLFNDSRIHYVLDCYNSVNLSELFISKYSDNMLYVGWSDGVANRMMSGAANAANWPNSKWILYTLVSTNNGKVVVFTNGVEWGRSANSQTNPWIKTNLTFCGVNWGPASYTGAVDEVTIYRRALSTGEIIELYTNGLSGIGYPWTGKP